MDSFVAKMIGDMCPSPRFSNIGRCLHALTQAAAGLRLTPGVPHRFRLLLVLGGGHRVVLKANSLPLSIAVTNQMCGLPLSTLGWVLTSSPQALPAPCIHVTIALPFGWNRVQCVAASMSRTRDSSCTESFKCTSEIRSITSFSISSFAPPSPIRCSFYAVSRLWSSARDLSLPPLVRLSPLGCLAEDARNNTFMAADILSQSLGLSKLAYFFWDVDVHNIGVPTTPSQRPLA